MQLYAESIQKLINNYSSNNNYGITLLTTYTYILQNNTVKNSNGDWVTSGGTWNSKWRKYNCYAYSIKRNENPSFYSTSRQYQPGDMSGAGRFSDCNDIIDLVDIVEKDLEKMGYTNIFSTPSITSNNWWSRINMYKNVWSRLPFYEIWYRNKCMVS